MKKGSKQTRRSRIPALPIINLFGGWQTIKNIFTFLAPRDIYDSFIIYGKMTARFPK